MQVHVLFAQTLPRSCQDLMEGADEDNDDDESDDGRLRQLREVMNSF